MEALFNSHLISFYFNSYYYFLICMSYFGQCLQVLLAYNAGAKIVKVSSMNYFHAQEV